MTLKLPTGESKKMHLILLSYLVHECVALNLPSHIIAMVKGVTEKQSLSFANNNNNLYLLEKWYFK